MLTILGFSFPFRVSVTVVTNSLNKIVEKSEAPQEISENFFWITCRSEKSWLLASGERSYYKKVVDQQKRVSVAN